MRINYILIGGLVGLASNLVTASSHVVKPARDPYGSHLAESKPLKLRIETFKDQHVLSPAHNAALDYWAHAYLADPTNEWTRKILDSLLGSPNIVRKCLIDLIGKMPEKYHPRDFNKMSMVLVTITDPVFLEVLDRAIRWSTDSTDWGALITDSVLWNHLDTEKRQARLRSLKINLGTALLVKYNRKPTEAARAGVAAGVPAELAGDYEAILRYASDIPGRGYPTALVTLAEFPDYITAIAALIPSLLPPDWEAIAEVMQRILRAHPESEERNRAQVQLGQLLGSMFDAAFASAATAGNFAL